MSMKLTYLLHKIFQEKNLVRIGCVSLPDQNRVHRRRRDTCRGWDRSWHLRSRCRSRQSRPGRSGANVTKLVSSVSVKVAKEASHLYLTHCVSHRKVFHLGRLWYFWQIYWQEKKRGGGQKLYLFVTKKEVIWHWHLVVIRVGIWPHGQPDAGSKTRRTNQI